MGTSDGAATGKDRARRPQGFRTRHAILRKAINIASVEGLEGLTIGRLDL